MILIVRTVMKPIVAKSTKITSLVLQQGKIRCSQVVIITRNNFAFYIRKDAAALYVVFLDIVTKRTAHANVSMDLNGMEKTVQVNAKYR